MIPSTPPVEILPAPPQDQGLPYTRSARKFALAKIKDCIVIFGGSRYAYVYGFKVRLDQAQLRGGEAQFANGIMKVPAAFSPVFSLKVINPEPAPDYLQDRWVYDLKMPAPPAGTAHNQMVDFGNIAHKIGMLIYLDERGLMVIRAKPFSLSPDEGSLEDSIITLFDTPEKFADPDIATRSIPTLARQGKMTDHVRVTLDQQAILDGPETKWPTAPPSEYNFIGFNKELLGSPVPPPGVYPRLFFSPQDVPMLAERMKKTKTGQRSLIEMEYLFNKTWWNTDTDDGKLFLKLSSGDVSGLEFDTKPDQPAYAAGTTFKGYKMGVFSSHIQYVPECLTAMALYCLLTNDDAHGKLAAAAIVNYFKLREPLLDEVDAVSDSEFGSSLNENGTVIPMNGSGGSTQWRTVAEVIAHMNLGTSLDFGGKWMSDDQKATMYRIIAKATYGRRSYGQDAPVRFRDVNWVGWDLTDFLAVASIEGQPGFDQEAFDSGVETVRSFCDWGIDDHGVVYESNAKTPGSFQFITLSMIIAARHGENYFGHPHWRQLATAQVEMTSPTGLVTVNSGTQYAPFSRALLSFQFLDEQKAFFPGDRRYDFLLDRAPLFGGRDDEGIREWDFTSWDANAFKQDVGKLVRLRLPSVTYPGFVHGVLYDTDFVTTTRADLNMPLDFVAPVHGVYSGYSDQSRDAAWINMLVRPDHYLGAGHHHADSGMFHFSGAGMDWFTQSPFDQAFSGKYFNLVQVDGHSEPETVPGVTLGWNAPGKFLGATVNGQASAASADLTYAYTYTWLTQPQQIWDKRNEALNWELEPDPNILKIFAGTSHYKLREWWSNYAYSNYMATSRAKFNPMEYVFRTVAMVRGNHPYGLVVDDLKKDDQTHLYQWAAMLNGGVWKADVEGLQPNELVLGYDKSKAAGPSMADLTTQRPALAPQPGDPLLLVCALQSSASTLGDLFTVETQNGPVERFSKPTAYDRVTINTNDTQASYHVLLIPYKKGEPLPNIASQGSSATVTWGDQEDKISFLPGANHKTELKVVRGDETLLDHR